MSDHPNDPLKYHKHPEWLAAIKTDWHDPALTVRQIGKRNNVHFTRPGQLSVLYGWAPRKRGPSGKVRPTIPTP